MRNERETAGGADDLPKAANTGSEGLRFLVDGGRLAEVDGFVELAVDGSLVGYSRSLLDVYGVGGAERERLAQIGDGVAHQRALTAMILRRVADPPERPGGAQRPGPSPSETTFEDVPLLDGRLVERYGVPLRRTDGTVAGRLFVVRDVTARRRAEQELRARAGQQEAMADLGARALRETELGVFLPAAVQRAAAALDPGSEVHLLAADAHGCLALRAFSGAGGGPTSDHVGARLEAGGPLLPAGALRAQVQGRAGPYGVLCAHRVDGRAHTYDELHFVETVANILSAALGRHEAERALAEREREVRAVFDHSLDGLVTFDDQALLVGANVAARRLLGPDAADDRGAWDGFEAALRRSWSTLRTTGRTGGELEVRLPGQSARQLEWSAIAWILPGRHLAVLRDVTEARLVQGRLALHERLASIGTLAGGMAHELNNPLAGLFADLSFVTEQITPLLPPGGEGGEVAAALRDARAAAERMRDIVRDLQTFARGEGGALEAVDARKVVESSLSRAWSEIQPRARLVRDLAEVPPVRAPEARLAQVVLKLLVNAAQSLPAGDPSRNEIRVSTQMTPAGRVCIEVADTGSGIAPEHLPHIFDPFFTTRPLGAGTGLGLPVCLGLVQALGGTLEVESELGRGSTFRVLLPAAEAAHVAAGAVHSTG
jgi:signal transduction histidine kinase